MDVPTHVLFGVWYRSVGDLLEATKEVNKSKRRSGEVCSFEYSGEIFGYIQILYSK